MKIKGIKNDVQYWQRLLRLGGYYTGLIDGIRGPATRKAEQAWDCAASKAAESMGRFDERSESVIATLLPITQCVARIWMKQVVPLAKEAGVEVRLICGTRSYAEQNRLFMQRPRVTQARGGQSMHNFGLAFDFGIFCGREYLSISPEYERLGRLSMNQPGVTWGGNWKTLADTPHIQLDLYPGTAATRAAFEK